jgi:hypothetical protein
MVTEMLTRLSVFSPQGSAGKASLLSAITRIMPWKITGPVSDPEWKEALMGADEYRVVSPG